MGVYSVSCSKVHPDGALVVASAPPKLTEGGTGGIGGATAWPRQKLRGQ